MKSNFFRLIFIITILVFIITPLLAQETPKIPSEPNYGPSAEEQRAINERLQEGKIAYALSILFIIISLIIGIISTIYIIKNPSKKMSIILYCLIFSGCLLWSFILFFQFIKYGTISEFSSIDGGMSTFLLLTFSGYILYNLIKKQDFLEDRKFTIGLSSGMIIASLLAIFSFLVIGYSFGLEILGIKIINIVLLTMGAIASFILGIIGFFIDKFKK
jgi:MFS family permease